MDKSEDVEEEGAISKSEGKDQKSVNLVRPGK
jgi:hypothetical protein